MKNKSLISISDYSVDEIMEVLELAKEFEKNPSQRIAESKVIASLFFEPSTRTMMSFESAANRLGARVIGFNEVSSTSVSKGESLSDTIKTVSLYSDLIVIRHHIEGAARFASEVSKVPVINAGDGANQHPTQCMLDLFSILRTQNTLDNLDIVLVGDLKFGRTVHSLVKAMTNFNTTFHLVSPVELKLPSAVKMFIKNRKLKYYQYTSMEEAIKKADIVYMTRIQRERFSDPLEYERVKNSYTLSKNLLVDVKPNMKILHPLPRVNEISEDVDNTPQAYYFDQALNGVYVRQALISKILGLK